MAHIQYGPVNLGFTPSAVRIRTLTGQLATTYDADGDPAAATIDGDGAVTFYADAGTYLIELSKAGTTDLVVHHVTLQEPVDNGGSVPKGYDQVEVDFASLGSGTGTEFVVPLTMSREVLTQWGGTMEGCTFEITVPANATALLRWITSETSPRDAAYAAIKTRKVRDDAGAIVANSAVWKAELTEQVAISPNTAIPFDSIDAATDDMEQGTSTHEVRFLTAGTYRVYAEIDLVLT